MKVVVLFSSSTGPNSFSRVVVVSVHGHVSSLKIVVLLVCLLQKEKKLTKKCVKRLLTHIQLAP
jgi:hypothetical protein